MLHYIVKRILSILPTIFVVSTVVFFIIHLTPGDPARVILGEYASKEDVQKLRHQLGLDKPLPIQLGRWYLRILQLDLGQSLFSKEPVLRTLTRNWQPTFILALLSIFLAVLIAIPIGVLASTRQNSPLDLIIMLFASLGISVPSFWLGLNLIVLFGVLIPIFPSQGVVPISKGLFTSLKHYVLPVAALAAPQVAQIARMTRSSMLEVLSKDYIRTARAKGLAERKVIYWHALRSAFIPIITIIGMRFGVLLGGIVVVERVFNIFGIGNLIVTSITRRDYPVVVGGVLLISLVYVIVNLIVDLLYVLLNPRIRYE
jgi:peptide/nickel transport system permease protein